MATTQAITLDLDDTLWPIEPVIGAAERALLRWFQEQAPRVLHRYDLAGLRRLRREEGEAAPELAHDLTELRLRSIRRALSDGGYDPGRAEAGLEAFMVARNRVTLYRDVLPVLDALAGRYRLGTISNGNACLERIGLAPRFDFRISAREAGAAKPDPAIFAAAVVAAGVDPASILHVGDDPERDVRGAEAAGMRAVLLDRRGDAARPASTGLVIRSLDQLPALLAAEAS